MPINKVGLVRTDGVHNAAAPAAPFVPLYSVLFWYGDDKNFINTPSGNLNFNYYRSYQELYNPLATYYKSDGSLAPQAKSNPLISCVNADFNWTTTTGVNITASTDMPATGATLFNPVSHGSAVITRSKIYNVLASTPGQATTPTFSYISQAGTNTHTHSVVSIANSLTNLSFGDPTPDGTSYNGINAINVKPILRDPRMYVDSGDVYNDTKLYCLPKDIVVFGNNLPTNNYTRSDTTHTYSATGQIEGAHFAKTGELL